MGCEGCFSTQKARGEALTAMRVKAREQAIQQGKPIAIIEDGGELSLCDAQTAIQNNYLIKDILSSYG